MILENKLNPFFTEGFFVLLKKLLYLCGMENNIDKTVEKLLNYSFSEIGWEYNSLTSVEKSLMTEEEFEVLKKKYGPQ